MSFVHFDSQLLNVALLLAAFAVFLIFAKIVRRVSGISVKDNYRFGQIDSLRGILTLTVFIHHFAINYFFHVNGTWQKIDSQLFDVGGQIAVSLFFMTTGFLFWGKIVTAEGKPDWKQIYVSRFFRLVPLYWIVSIFVIVFVSIKTLGNINTDYASYFHDVLTWLLFLPTTINGFPQTTILIAGVNWTLVYQWVFYFSLPLLAGGWLIARTSKFFMYSVLGLLIAFCIVDISLVPGYLTSRFAIYFLLGAITFKLSDKPEISAFFQNFWTGVIPVGAFVVTMALFKDVYSALPAVFVFVIFAPIALGCSLFGVLNMKSLKLLGEVSYSIYLLHGAVLYILFTLLFPQAFAQPISFWAFSGLLFLCGLLVITLSIFSYRLIELPFIRLGQRLNPRKSAEMNTTLKTLQ